MKVVYISTYPPIPCGVGVYTSKLLREVKKHIEAFVIGPRGSSADFIAESFIFRKHEDYAKELFSYAKELNPDVVHIQHEYGIWGYGEEFFKLLNLLKKLDAKIVITMHSVDHPLRKENVVAYNRKIGEIVDAIIVHSTLQEFELAIQGVEHKKIRVIPHGTDILKPIKSEKAKEKLGISEEIKTFGYVGFIRRDKRLVDLVYALEIIKKKMKNVLLIIAGKPQRKVHEEHYLKNLKPIIEGRNDVLHVNKFLSEEEFILYMSALDVVVFPYVGLSERRRYAVSGAFHHALSLAKAIVASRTPRLYEYLLLAPELTFIPGDYKTLAEKVLLLFQSKEIYQKILEKIRDYAQKTSWREVAKQHISLYKSL